MGSRVGESDRYDLKLDVVFFVVGLESRFRFRFSRIGSSSLQSLWGQEEESATFLAFFLFGGTF